MTAARDAVRAGTITKAVIAREIAVTCDRPIDRHGVLQLTLTNRPASARTAIVLYVRKRGHQFPTKGPTLRLTSSRLRTRVTGTLTQATITYSDPTRRSLASAPLTMPL